jgi:hypothetical protein
MIIDARVGDHVRVLSAASREPEINGEPVNKWPPFCSTGFITRYDLNSVFVRPEHYIFEAPDKFQDVECRFYRNDLELISRP